MLWKALGTLAAGQNDPAAARQAFTEWARLQPDSPESRASLFELALASGDEAEVEALKSVGGPKAPYWRIARVEQILRARPVPKDDAPREAGRLDEAGRLIQEAPRRTTPSCRPPTCSRAGWLSGVTEPTGQSPPTSGRAHSRGDAPRSAR